MSDWSDLTKTYVALGALSAIVIGAFGLLWRYCRPQCPACGCRSATSGAVVEGRKAFRCNECDKTWTEPVDGGYG